MDNNTSNTTERDNEKRKDTPVGVKVLRNIIIGIVIVVVALFITVYLVDDFDSIGDLFSFIGKQF